MGQKREKKSEKAKSVTIAISVTSVSAVSFVQFRNTSFHSDVILDEGENDPMLVYQG